MRMTDREFLIWLHEHLENKCEERPETVHMKRLRAIICYTPPWECSPSNTNYSIEQLKNKDDI